jgi:hypothetical protein
MDRRRVALACFLVGLLLLPGPAYAMVVDWADGPDRTRSPSGYQATEIDVSNDSLVAERYTSAVTFYAPTLTYRHAADYRARNETSDVLVRAIRTGNATTDDPAVVADVRSIQRNYSFVTVEYDTVASLELSADDEATRVRATPVGDAEIAAAVREELVVSDDSLSPAERRTFEKIRNATVSEAADDYRPWSDEPVPPTIVRRGDTYYAVEQVSSTDEFGSPGLFVGLAASAVGIVLLVVGSLVGIVGLVLDWRRPE